MPKIISFPDVPGKEFEVGDDFTPADAEELYDLYRPESSTIRRVIGDTAVGLAKGVVALPQSVAGLVDIGTGLAGVGSFTKTIKPVVDFQMTQDVLSEFYSPEAKRSQKALQSAKGLTDTVSTVLKNPSIIQQQISESLPQMLGGAAAAGKMAAKGVGRALAAGGGEGLITAGQQAVGIEEATGDELSRKQAGLALVSGVFTGALGSFGNKVADKLGLVDINLLTSPGTSETVKRGIVARAIGGAITEGALEELPQSVQEQIAQNIATDKPWNEGLAQAGVIGTVVGGLMGGTAQALPRGQAPAATVPSEEPATPVQPDQPMFNEGRPILPATEVDRISKGIEEALSEIPAEEVLTTEPEVAPVSPEVATQEPEVATPIQEVAPQTTQLQNRIVSSEKVEGLTSDDISKLVMQAVHEGGIIKGIKEGQDVTGSYVVIPVDPNFPDDPPSAIGPFVSREAADDFLEAEVGAPGAKVIDVKVAPTFVPPEPNLLPLTTQVLQEQAAPKPSYENTGIGSAADEFGAIYGPTLNQVQIDKFKEQAGESFDLPSQGPIQFKLKVKPSMLWMEASEPVPGSKFEENLGVAYMKIRADGTTVLDASKHKRPIDKAAADQLISFLNQTRSGEKTATTTQGEQNALQEPPATESLLRQTRPELGLPQVVQGNTQQEVATETGQKEEVEISGYDPSGVSTQQAVKEAVSLVGKDELKRRSDEWLKERNLPETYRFIAVESSARQVLGEHSYKSAIDRAISVLESKIKSPTDTTQSVIIPGLDPATARAVWNTALRIAIGVLKATKNVQRAIQAGINHIKKELAARRLTLSTAQEDDLRQSMEGEAAYKKGVIQRAALNVIRGTALPKSMVEARRRQLDHQKFIEESIKLKSEDVKASINAEFKTAADREAATDRLSRFLSGAIPVRAVGGPEVQLRAAALRASIDNLSLLAINESMVTGDMATTWLGNMGEWLKRTYLAFDSTADWNYDTLKRRKAKGEVEINRIWKDAHDFLASQNPKWDEARIEAEMRSLIDRVTIEDVLGIQSKSTPGSGPKLSTEISSLLQRKDIPVEIRDWMGEIKDPYARVLQSGKWLAQFITRNLAQRELATIGLETGVLSEKKSGRYTEELFPNQLDFIPQRDPVTGEVVKDASGNPLGQYSTRVDRRHEPLAGYWTTPEFRDALEEFDSRLNNTIATLSFGSLVGKGILTGTSYQKGALVGWNPASYMVNMIGGAVLRLASGHVNPVHLFRALNAVAFGGKPISSTSTRRALIARADYLMSAKAGTTGKGILLGDIEANLSREREAGAGKRAINAIKGILSDPKAKGQWVKLKRSLDDLWRIPGDYGIRFMDDVFRASAFFDELSLAKSAFPGMPQDEQVKWAADRALNVYQNYDRLPKGLRDASRIGALNTFVSFKAEMFRNAYWIARYAKEGLSSSNPELKRDGAQKLAGLVIMTALPLVLAAMSRSKNDIEDDEDAAIKRWIVPPWDRSEELVYISGKDGKYTYVPLGYLLPTFEYTRPFTTIWNAANDPNPDEAVKKALSGWASDYLGPGAFLGPIFEAASNRRIGAEKKISMKEGMGGVKERVSHVTESFTPRGIRMLEEAYKAYNKIPGDFAKEYSMDEIAAKLAGLRERRVDVHKAAPFVLRPFGIRWREASSDENLQSRKYPAGSPEALEAKRYEAETKARLKILYRQAITDLKRLGVTQTELYSIIQDLKLPAELRQ